MRVAVIDLGTNTFHLLIADVDKNGNWKRLHHSRITVKLGQGGIQKSEISDTAFRRGMKAITKFAATAKSYKVRNIHAFGTAALRTSKNGKHFLKEVLKLTGIKIQLISGDREAQLIFEGVKQAVEIKDEKVLIMDIGGGSVEFIIASNNKIIWKQSFKLGAAFLLGHFNPSDPIKGIELDEIRTYIRKNLQPLFKASKKYKPSQLIGSAGSFETIASIIRHRYKNTGTHYGKTSHPIKINHFNGIYKELLKSNKDRRFQMKGLIKMRADMIVLAAILLNEVLDNVSVESMQLSSYALKEGALWEVIHTY